MVGRIFPSLFNIYLDKTGEKHGQYDHSVYELILAEVRIVVDETSQIMLSVGEVAGVAVAAAVLSPFFLQTISCIQPFLEEYLGAQI